MTVLRMSEEHYHDLISGKAQPKPQQDGGQIKPEPDDYASKIYPHLKVNRKGTK
jgi:hypothetical protein